MEEACPTTTTAVAEVIDEMQAMVAEPLRRRPSLLGEASSFLITLGIRAAQNHAVYCLDEWIAPSPGVVASERGPILVDGGSNDDRSSF